MPTMQPTTGDRQVAHTGDWHRVELVPSSDDQTPDTCRAFLRTNLGRASTLRKEIIQSRAGQNAIALFSWQDLLPAHSRERLMHVGHNRSLTSSCSTSM